MSRKSPIAIALTLILFLQPLSALAFETDQFNLPPVPLADVGDEVTEYVETAIVTAVEKVNADIDKSENCVASTSKVKGCSSIADEKTKLAALRTNNAVASQLYHDLAGSDLMFTKFGKWMNSHKFRAEPSRYVASYGDSIFLFLPTDYLTISPTVKLYGYEFGVDKLEHLFQQGYRYYKSRNESLASGKTPGDAVKKAVKWGRLTELTYYGLLTSNVYSNADLVSNYIGMEFYRGLTEPVSIGEKTRPATLSLADGKWKVADANLRENLLKPFLTDHLNEALNPSGYGLILFAGVRVAVRKHACPKWKAAYPTLTAAELKTRAKSLELWNGADYGHANKGTQVTIADMCYSDK